MSNEIISFSVDGLAFSKEPEKDEPLILDIDLAVRLEYKRPRSIRTLIRRMIKEGDLSGINCRYTVQRQSPGQGGERSFRVEEFWLTEAQALKVAMCSGTAKGHALFDEVVRVFILARKGLLPSMPAHYGPDLDHIRTGIDRLLERDDVRAGRVGDSDYARRKVKGAISAAAESAEKTFARVHGEVRNEFKVPGYLLLPIVSLPDVIEFLQECMRNTKVAKLARQLSLWPLSDGTPLLSGKGRKGGGKGGSGGQLDS